MRVYVAVVIIGAALVSCNKAGTKKLLVMGRGTITANENNIVMKDGAGHAEKEIDLEDKQTELNVDAGDGSKLMKMPAETGYYILNLKKDTIIGSEQKLGKDISRTDIVTQEELKHNIDSLEKLVAGANIKAGGANVMILPGQLVKVSSNADAKVYGPFTGIPSEIERGQDGKDPQLFKFYTCLQLKERIARLRKEAIY